MKQLNETLFVAGVFDNGEQFTYSQSIDQATNYEEARQKLYDQVETKRRELEDEPR